MHAFLLVTSLLLATLSLPAAGSECGTLNLQATGEVKTLTSPYYPDLYPSNLICSWRISSDRGQDIVIKVDDLFLEDTTKCTSDSLTIYRGSVPTPSSLIKKFCAFGTRTTILTHSSSVLVQFISDSSGEERGFKLQYHAGVEQGCQTTLTDSYGIITSPRYPSDYPDYSDCTTLISLPPEKNVYLTFQELILEYDEGCKSDYVEIFDGPNKQSKSLGRFCRSAGTLNVQSSSNQLYVVFHSDHLVSAKGFKAIYSSDGYKGVEGLEGRCTWKRSDFNGSIASPGYPQKFPAKSDCGINLTGPRGSTLAIVFEDFDIPDCSNSYLEIEERRASGRLMSRRLCGSISNLPQKVIISRNNEVTIIFKTTENLRKAGKGFRATYFVLEEKYPAQHNVRENDLSAFNEYPRNATVKKGSRHVLTCKPKKGLARWFKNRLLVDGSSLSQQKRVALEGSTLIIQSMSPEDAGIYTCLAYTEEGKFAAHAWITLAEVKDCSEPLVPHPPPREIVIREKESLTLSCLPRKKDQQILWMKNGVIFDTKRGSKNGVLKIPKAAWEDSGVYECWTSGRNNGCEERHSIKVTVKTKTRVCGIPRIQPNTTKPSTDNVHRVVGGREAKRGSYPWQVALYHVRQSFFCGASLINDQWMVTAAHCYKEYDYEPKDTFARLGKNNLNTNEDGQINVDILDVIVHDMYDLVPNDHDIAVVKLKRKIVYTEYILPICVDMPSQLKDVIAKDGVFLNGVKGTVTGWGRLLENGEYAAVLQELVLPIQAKTECKRSTSSEVTENMFCAGYKQEILDVHKKADACQGDSGGPFISKDQGRWVLVGVVSWGKGCARKGQYGFYTKVDRYYDWISNRIDG